MAIGQLVGEDYDNFRYGLDALARGRGWSPKRLAEEVDLEGSRVWDILAGNEESIDSATADDIAAALGLTVVSLTAWGRRISRESQPMAIGSF